MKNIKPFGPVIGKTRISNNFIKKINNEFDLKIKNKNSDYSSKLASQIRNEIKLNSNFIKKNLWVFRKFKGEYNPVHYHENDLSGVGYLKLPKNMTTNKEVKNKKIRTNGTIDFINGQKNFLSKSIYNIFPNYLMHTAYPFNIEGERRSFSFNLKIIYQK